MTEGTGEFPYDEPVAVTKGAEETGGELVRFELTVHPSGGGADDLPHRRHIIDNPGEHVHPHQEERIEVLSGEYTVAIEGSERTLSEGEELILPEGIPHRHWNPTERPIRVVHEHRPARASEEYFETLYALAQAGRTDENGIPNPLQFAVINDAYPGQAYTTDLPVTVQRALSTLLAPVGRLAGYEATYSREDIDALR